MEPWIGIELDSYGDVKGAQLVSIAAIASVSPVGGWTGSGMYVSDGARVGLLSGETLRTSLTVEQIKARMKKAAELSAGLT